MAAAEQAFRSLDAAQQHELERQVADVHAGGSGTESTLYGAADNPERSAPAGHLPFQFVLKGDSSKPGQLRPTRVRPLPGDQTPPTTVIGQPTMRLETATLNTAQQSDEALSDWTLPPEYQGTIGAFYKRTEETKQ